MPRQPNQQQQEHEFYSIPYVTNYVRDQYNFVYCVISRRIAGNWESNTNRLILDAPNLNMVEITDAEDYAESVAVEFTPQYVPYNSPNRREPIIHSFTDVENDSDNTLSALYEPLEDGEEVRYFRLEGTALFICDSVGRVIHCETGDCVGFLRNITVVQLTVGVPVAVTDFMHEIILFPQYSEYQSQVPRFVTRGTTEIAAPMPGELATN